MSPVVRFTVAGRVPPPPDHVPIPPPRGDLTRSLDVQLAARRTEEDLFVFVSFPLFLLAAALFVFGKYIAASLVAAWLALFFLATRYARRPRINHRLARMLRATFYQSFTYPGDRRAPRLNLRLCWIVAISILMGLLLHR